MSFAPLTFTGISSFSQDFQTILNRATQIASLPITALQNQQKDLLQQKLLVTNLSGAVDSLASSVSALGALGDNKALSASSTNTAKVTASNVNSSAPANYTITEITSVAKAAAETSVSGYADSTAAAVSSTGTVQLTVGSSNYSINLTGKNNLTGLRDAINNLGAGVTASVLTTGTGANPYYLSVTANSTGATTLELRDDPAGANTNLLTTNNQGANTEFLLNGVLVSKKTTFINDVVPGVTFNILATTDVDESVTVNIASDRSKVSTALQSFVANYNAVREQLNAQIGSGAGLLSGDFLIREVQSRLRSVTSYEGGDGSITSLGALGVEFDRDGVASLNSDVFNALTSSQISDSFSFLGSSSTGFGGRASLLTTVSDAVTGLAKIQLDKYEETDSRISEQVAKLSERLSTMQLTLSAKLQAADSLLASLQSQQSVLDASIQSLNYSLYGRKDG
jgi:flagellar hook-associated protein 2